MTSPLPEQPHRDAGQRPDQRYLGVSEEGRHMYTYREAPHVCQHHTPPRPAPPVGRYVAAAIGGTFLLLALMISLVLATICAVCLTACLIILRSMWREYQQEKENP